MPVHRLVGALGLCLALASNAAAQDQTIVVDQPLQLCGTSKEFPLSTFDEVKAEALVKAALGIKEVDRTTYYVIHATQFVDRRMVVAAEHWYVYYKPWQEKPACRRVHWAPSRLRIDFHSWKCPKRSPIALSRR